MSTIPVSATVQTSPPSSGTSTTGLKPGLRTFSLTGTMGTTVVQGDAVRLWGSNDGGTTFQPLRQNGQPVTISFTQPEVVINDACDHYATQRIAVGAGSALAAVGFGGEANGAVDNPWLVGGNNLGGTIGVLGTNDASDLRIKSHGATIVSSDGDVTGFASRIVGIVGAEELDLVGGFPGGVSIASTSNGPIGLAANGTGILTLTRGSATWNWPATDAAGPLRSNGSGGMFFGPVNVEATNTNAQSIVDGAGAAILTTWTETTDTASAFVAATGLFTVPTGRAGFYMITAEIEFAAIASIVAGEFVVSIFKNGALARAGVEVCQVAAANVKRNPKVSFCMQLAAGDVIDVRASQNSGSGADALTNVAARNFLSISLVG